MLCFFLGGGGSGCIWEMGACKKQICRPPGVHVTCENESGELLHRPHEARGHRAPTKEKDEMQMMKVAIIEKDLGNLSVDRLQVPSPAGRRAGEGEGAVVAGRKGQKVGEEGFQREQGDIERLKRRGESGTGPSAV